MKKILLFCFALSTAHLSNANVYTVTSAANGTTNDGVSLRWAITQASTGSNNSIQFNIPGMAPHTIKVETELPYLYGSNNVIDGTTQPANGYTGDDPKIIITTDSIISNGLYCFVTDQALIKGIWVKGFAQYGIYVFGSYANATIDQCKFSENGTGIYVLGSLAYGHVVNTLVTDNLTYGIYLVGSVAWIDVNSSTVVDNGSDGIYVFGAAAYSYIRNNVISGNLGNGINDGGSSGSVIKGNKIGTDSAGVIPWGNQKNGVYIGDSNDSIGGEGLNEGNIIANNILSGIYIAYGSGNPISRNSIFCNGEKGIYLSGGANNSYPAPKILSATQNDVSGTAKADSKIELFAADLETGCNDCEGKNYKATIIADNAGNWTYSGFIGSGIKLSATATDTARNTSEFSECVTIIATGEQNLHAVTSTIYPNPATSMISFRTGIQESVRLEIHDALGRIVWAENITGSNDIDVSKWNRGVYFYRLVIDENHSQSGKTILQ